MNFKSYLGKKPEEIKELAKIGKVSEVFDELNDDEEQEYCVESYDQSFEMVVNEDGIISTVFLYPEHSKELIDGIDKLWQRNTILEKFGSPHESGEEHIDEILGEYGGWDKYNYNDYSLHIEYKYGELSIKLVTIMLPWK